VGTYQDQQGQSACRACLSGTYKNNTGASRCDLCSPGTFQGAAVNQTKVCASNPTSPFQNISAQNATGQFQNGAAAGAGATVCQLCAQGHYADVYGMTQCLPCDLGSAQALLGQARCEPCGLGKHMNTTGQPFCTDCKPGRYADVPGLAECKPCAMGTFQEGNGASSCPACKLTYWTTSTGQPNCVPCEVGKFGNSSGCFDCARGRYNPAIHQSKCRACEPGKSVNQMGQGQCYKCGKGNVASNFGMVQCEACPAHGDSNFEGTECLCDPGYYLPFYKQDSKYTCIPCPIGADCSAAGNTYFNLRSEVGWWRSSNSSLNFYRCPIRAQCLSSVPQGGSATYTGGFAQVDDGEYDDTGDETRSAATWGASEVLRRTRRLVGEGDGATSVPVDVCGPPYFRCGTQCQTNRAAALCTQCLPNYREDVSGECSPCPTGNNVISVVFIVIAILIAV
jgi:hypothetical protein